MEEFARVGKELTMEGRNNIDVQRIFYKMEPRTLRAALRFYCNEELVGAHDALADVRATVDVLKGQIKKYDGVDLKVDEVETVKAPIVNDMDALHKFTSDLKTIDATQRLKYNSEGVIIFNFGKYANQPVVDVILKDKNYYNWIINKDFSSQVNCCTYPDLQLNLAYKQKAADTLSVSSSNFKLGTFYALENTQDSIAIDTFQLFLSQIKPINFTSLDTICVLETIDFTKTNTAGDIIASRVEDNIALVDGLQFSFDLGTYQSDLDVEQVDLTIGLSDELSQINPDNITTNNNLGDTYNYLFNKISGAFPSMRVKFTLKNTDKQRIITRDLTFEEHLSTTFTTPIVNKNGQDLSLLLRINVLDVFKGIIFDVEIEDIDLIINTNLASSLSLIES